MRIKDVAKDFRITESCLTNWFARADREDGKPDPTTAEAAELRELKKRNRLLEQENEAPRRRGVSVPGEPAGKMMFSLVRGGTFDVPVGRGFFVAG